MRREAIIAGVIGGTPAEPVRTFRVMISSAAGECTPVNGPPTRAISQRELTRQSRGGEYLPTDYPFDVIGPVYTYDREDSGRDKK